jgi:hypothetical protein
MEPDEITQIAKTIKQHLQRRSGKSWSVRSVTRGAGYGGITINIPWKGEHDDYQAASEELGRLMGYNRRQVQMYFSATEEEYVQRARGEFVDPTTCGRCGTVENQHKMPYCERCQHRVAQRQYK